MIRAVRRGYFVFPGDRTVRKSYAYVEGLIESIDFALSSSEPYVLYNYVERDTETLDELVRAVQDEFDCHRPAPSVPRPGPRRSCGCRPGGDLRPLSAPSDARSQGVDTDARRPALAARPRLRFRYDFRTSLRTGAPPHRKTSTSALDEHRTSEPVSGRVDAQIRAAADRTPGPSPRPRRSFTRPRFWGRAPRCYGSRTSLRNIRLDDERLVARSSGRLGALVDGTALASSSRRNGRSPSACAAGASARRRPSRACAPLAISAQVRAALERVRPHVVHANTLLALPEAAVARSCGLPVVLQSHELPAPGPKTTRDHSLCGGHRRRARRRVRRGLRVASPARREERLC